MAAHNESATQHLIQSEQDGDREQGPHWYRSEYGYQIERSRSHSSTLSVVVVAVFRVRIGVGGLCIFFFLSFDIFE